MRKRLVLLLCSLAACRGPDLRETLGEQTVIAFEGARAFSEDELLAAIDADRSGETRPERASRAQVDDAAYAIEELYRKHGYAEATVAWEHGVTEEGARARFTITEGPQLLLESVTFTGNEGVDSETLSLFFRPDPDEETPFVSSAARTATNAIETYYYRKGWLAARVTGLDEHVDEERGRVRLDCSIAEGPRSRLRSVEVAFESDAEELDAVRRALERAAAPHLDHAYTPPIAYGMRAALLEALGNNARPDAEVEFEATVDPTTGDARLAYRVDPGPRIVIGAIRVEGVSGGHEGLVRERLELSEGDAYSAKEVRKSFANLYRSGLFRSVRIDLEHGEGEERELVVRVEELPSIEFFLLPGYGSYEGIRLTFGVDERNLLGTGTGLRAESTVGFLAQGATIAWTDPWVDRGRYETRVAVNADHREEPAFTQTEYGTELSLARLWSEDLRSTLTYAFRRNELDDVDLDPDEPLPEDALEDANIGSFALGTTHDDREGLFTPHGGGRERLSVEWASPVFGSEIDYVGGNAELTHFWELFRGTVLAARWLAGLKYPVSNTAVLPLQERYFNGGENTVRSFAEDELGPSDADGDPEGGEAFNVWNVELRQELVGSLEAGLFFDAGNVVADSAEYLSFDDVRTGIGVGLRYLLPIGPVRLDVGWNPDPREEEDDYVVHLSIGMAF